jgi:hypothetical protein
MHLKCGESDLVQNTFNSSISYDSTVPLVETFQFENKTNELGYSIIDYGIKEKNSQKNEQFDPNMQYDNDKKNTVVEPDESRQLWNKLKDTHSHDREDASTRIDAVGGG